METVDKIKKLGRQLYPTGRAFKMPLDGVFDKLNNALSKSEARFVDDAISILDSAIPDNDNFTEDDATDWERRLGLITSEGVSLADRKAAIIRKMNHPGDIKTRQNYRYLERELQAAGFDLYVTENRFDDGMGGYETDDPIEVPFEHGMYEHGEMEHGGAAAEMVVNSIDNEEDRPFSPGSNFRSTFFVGGTPYPAFANVDADRELELRQLILKIKPVQTVCFLYVNFV